MWKLRIVVALVVSLAASVMLWLPASSALEKPRTFSLLEVERTFTLLGAFTGDRPPVGGDRFMLTGDLYRWTGAKSKGPRVGHDRVLVTFMTGYGTNQSHRATVLVNAQAYLPDGTVLIEGYGSIPPNSPAKMKLPVVGGTGVYHNAGGYVSVRNLSGGGEGSKLEFHLVP